MRGYAFGRKVVRLLTTSEVHNRKPTSPSSPLHKPLFNPNLLDETLQGFAPYLTREQHDIVDNWARTAADPKFREQNEKPLQGQFLNDIFGKLLGYTPMAGHLDAYHLKAESASSEIKGAHTPDGRLGFFGHERDLTRVIIELKAPYTDLDARQSGHGGLTPVEQAFGYLSKFDDCRWVIVSDFVGLRLYSKKRGQIYAHAFELAELAQPAALRRFCYLLGRDQLIAPPPDEALIDQLLARTQTSEHQITRTFYTFYNSFRQRLFRSLLATNPPKVEELALAGETATETAQTSQSALPEAATASPAHALRLLSHAQKLLDRILFICFAEDTLLLPHGVIGKALQASSSGFVVTTRWQQLCGLFRAIDQGNPPMGINGYNGGLFKHDAELEALEVDPDILAALQAFSDYDFRTELNVNILGHVFEQSITDLEAMRADIEGGASTTSRRKQEGVFYTPDYITQYIVSQTIGAWLDQQFRRLEALHDPEAIPDSHHLRKRDARIRLWQAYQEVLRTITICDPACGSGAFLVAAFDYLHAEYTRTNEHLNNLRGGHPELFDLDKLILQQNLFGVDLNPESVEITKLALWLKTARKDKPLNNLDANIRCGNSLISPHPDLSPELSAQAFDWHHEFPQIFGEASTGFHCIIGNPPYIRQEWLSPCKSAFQREYQTYAGTADAYLYFIERGLQLLQPNGRLGFITSGTFTNANFAKPFRDWLPTHARYTHLVNFGENQPFEDAEMVYPTISILEKNPAQQPFTCYFMRDKIPDNLPDAVAAHGITCDASVFRNQEWRFQSAPVARLFDKIMSTGRPLDEVVEGRMYYGVKTGLNEAFIIDQVTRDRMIKEEPRCAEILKKLLQGQDLRPWYYKDEGRWIIAIPSGWTISRVATLDETEAWSWFFDSYSPIAVHLHGFEKQARKRSDQGQFWWELRSCDYYDAFDEPKIVWSDIAKLPRFSWDTGGSFVNNTAYFLCFSSPWLLAFMQSRIAWAAVGQVSTPLRLRAGLWQYRCFTQFIERLPIPETTEADRDVLSALALQATEIANQRHQHHEAIRHRILTDLGQPGDTLNQKLTAWYELDFRTFRNELKKALKTDIPLRDRPDWESALHDWQLHHTTLTAKLIELETTINERVNALFQLTAEEVKTLHDHMAEAQIDYRLGEV